MADLLHQSGLLPLAEQPPAPSRQHQQGTLHLLRQSGTDHV
jgi:hypothetical protein